MEPTDPKKVGRRLRAIMADRQYETVQSFATAIGGERGRVSNWINGYHLPPVEMGTKIVALIPGLTLDWLYRGVADAIPVSVAIRLGALENIGRVPGVVEELAPPEPAGAPAPQKAKGRAAASSRRRQGQEAT